MGEGCTNKKEDVKFTSSFSSGQGRIRTAEAMKQQIYSLPVLTTYLPTQCIVEKLFIKRLPLNCDANLDIIFESAKQNLSFLSQ